MSQDIDKNRKRSAVTVGITTAFVTTFSSSAFNLAIPDMSAYFNMGAASAGWLVTAYMIVIACFSVPFGKVADATGRRRVLLIGLYTFGIASVLSVFAWASWVILTLRALQGLAAAMIFATNYPIAISAFPPQQRGRIIGILTSGTYTGLTLGPVLGGILNQHLSWRGIYYATALICAIALWAAIRGLEPDAQCITGSPTRKAGLSNSSGTDCDRFYLDSQGIAFFALTLGCLIYGLTSLGSLRWAWVLLLAAAAAGFGFAATELRAKDPLIDVRILAGNRVFALSNLTALFNYSATFGLGYILSIYLQVARGYSSQAAGIILIAQPLLMAALSPRMGRLSDRVAPYKLASLGMGVCALSLAFFIFLTEGTPISLIIGILTLAGVGIALFSSPNTNVVMSCVEPSKFGVANAILSTMRTTGQSTGIAIITSIVGATIGNVSLYDVTAEELLTTIHISFVVFAALCVAGIFMSLSRRR